MPIYEYRCTACNAEFEKLVFGASPVVACEKCDSQKTEKLMSRFGMGKSSSDSGSSASAGGRSGCGGCSSSNCSSCG